MIFERAAMNYDDGLNYKWNIPVNPYIPYYMGGGKDIKFDPGNGNEVLYFINYLFEKYPLKASKQSFTEIEELLLFDLPWWKRSHEKIEKWILKNW